MFLGTPEQERDLRWYRCFGRNFFGDARAGLTRIVVSLLSLLAPMQLGLLPCSSSRRDTLQLQTSKGDGTDKAMIPKEREPSNRCVYGHRDTNCNRFFPLAPMLLLLPRMTDVPR